MKNVEQEVKSWIEKKIIYIAFIAIFLLGIAVRIMLRKFVSRDAQIFLLPWYEEIKSNGGISSLGNKLEIIIYYISFLLRYLLIYQ